MKCRNFRPNLWQLLDRMILNLIVFLGVYIESLCLLNVCCFGFPFVDIVDGEGPEAREGDLVEVNYVCRRSNGYFVHR